MRKRIYSGGPLEKKFGYCRATRVGDLVFVSGSTAMKDGQVVGVGDPAAQTRQIVATIEKALREAGSSMDEVVRYRLFVTNAEDFPAVLKALGETFGGIHPSAPASSSPHSSVPNSSSRSRLMPSSAAPRRLRVET